MQWAMKSFQLFRNIWSADTGFSHTLKTMVISIGIVVINMATGIITARGLAPTGRGDQSAMMIWSQFLPFILTFGLPAALLYNMKRYKEERASLFSASIVLGVMLGFVAIGIGVLFIPWWLQSSSHEVVMYAQWFLLQAPIVMLLLMNNAVLQVEGEFTLYNRLRYVPPFATLVLLCVLMSSNRLTPVSVSLSYLIPTIPIVLWSTHHLLKRYGWKLLHFKRSCQRLFGYGIRSYGIDLLGNISNHLDKVILVAFLSAKELGLYVVALSLARMVNIIYQSAITVLFPKATGMAKEKVVDITLTVFRISMFIGLCIALILTVIAPYVLVLLYGEAFAEAITIFQILLFDAVLAGGIMILAQAFMALNLPGKVTVTQGIGLSVTLPLVIVLEPLLGLVGAGAAVLIATCFRFVAIWLQYWFVLKVKVWKLFLLPQDVRWLFQQLKR
ncbi:lipopolysaccharide biosynthesis protein [Longirhabdus pacifica]|uniref:lipopolysaccharide biosynthesis protein n=1 Tax=Longirhabdus pacifica TaxID=2305227 RepID=UPI0010093049|nr:oligosaccharide flippase family protein [Longirhabdus pacifica]